ncbi:MAG TPA: alpha/beta hydrolase [Acidimicrobiia bacterium]|jgi:pimeloyl-ACP methyl ester carboxylesterase
MPNVTANGLTIEYETTGDPDRPAVLLVMGLGAQLVYWPDEFCQALAARGFYVIRYDNRDVGLSTKTEGPPPDVMAAFQGDTSQATYTVVDMAADGMGLLDALGVGAAHVVGVSMGGMIAQNMAIHHPDRVLTLCSIMSTPNGDMSSDPASSEANAVLLRPPPRSREEAVTQSLEASRVIGSPGFPVDEDQIRARAALSYDRCFYPLGIARQLCAIVASGDWRPSLAKLEVPTLVIHGGADPLVRPSWGRATAEAIPGAELLIVDGMGHDLPRGAWSTVVEAIVANTAKAA